MIEENYLYVDKTREIYNLFSDGGKYVTRGKRVVLVGVGFDIEARNIGNYILEPVNA